MDFIGGVFYFYFIFCKYNIKVIRFRVKNYLKKIFYVVKRNCRPLKIHRKSISLNTNIMALISNHGIITFPSIVSFRL